MAENDSELRCCLNLIGGVLNYISIIFALVFGVCALLNSTSIGPLFISIVVLIGLLILIGVLCLIHCCISTQKSKDHLLNVVTFCIRLWCSCVLGLMSFVDISGIKNVKTALTWMLLVSIVIKAVWSIGQRCYGLIKYSPSPVTWAEMVELVGFLVTGLVFLPEDQAIFYKYALFLNLVSFAVIIVAVRLVACFYKPYIIFVLMPVVVCQVVFFTNVDVPFYDAALGCFAGRLFMDPLFDLFSSNISINERLNCVFSIHGFLQKIFIIIVIVFEGVFLFHAGVSVIDNKEWYGICFFVVSLFVWICCHSYFIHLCWHFSNKISECTKAYQALKGSTSMEKMMATKGMRLQAQLTHCLTHNTIGSTFLLGIVTLLISSGEQPWHKEDKAALAASCLIVLLVEGMFVTATDTLRKSLPGACTACVIMPPSKSHGQSELKELRKSIMEFFDHNAVTCSMESFVDGLSVKTLKGKLKGFFDQTIPDTVQQRYDSYVVYYCGDVDSDGKWELTGGKFEFGQMQRLWDICNTEGFQSRLILIQDAKNSKDWLEKITNDKNNVIAMQTCKLSRSRDPETGVMARVGDFTRDWIKFNISTGNNINWKERGREIKAVYKVSPSWSDKEFHVPNENDMTEYISKFPRRLNCLIRTLLIPAKFKEKTNCCPSWTRFMMSWFPPPSVDTGHGFKLVKS